MKIAKDKLMHAGVGASAAIATIGLSLLGSYVGLAVAGLAGAVAVGFAYELLQKFRGEGSPEVADALATAAGGLIVAIATSVVVQL